jgi:hypothetical protein
MSLPDVSNEVTPSFTGGTLRGVSYNELPDSMLFDYDNGKPRGVRKFHVAWSNRHTFIQAMTGEQLWRDDKLVSARLAQTFPGFDSIVAIKGHVRGHGRYSMTSGVLTFDVAEVTIEYGPFDKSLTAEATKKQKDGGGGGEEERVLGTESIDFSGEYMLAPEGGFKWAQYKHAMNAYGIWVADTSVAATDAGKAIAQQVPIFIPSIDHVYVKSDLKTIPDATLRKCLGKVNNNPWPTFKRKKRVQAGVGFVLCAGARASRQILASGAKPYELTVVLKERMIPWNALWNSTDKAWIKTDPVMYEEGDFSELLKYVAQE